MMVVILECGGISFSLSGRFTDGVVFQLVGLCISGC
jgi:hypothetical protein